jgi:hypothetical protein
MQSINFTSGGGGFGNCPLSDGFCRRVCPWLTAKEATLLTQLRDVIAPEIGT